MVAVPDSNQPLIRYLTTQSKLDRELALLLNNAARDTELKIARLGPSIRADQLTIVLRDLRRIQNELWVRGVGPAIDGSLSDAEKAADLAANSLDAYLRQTIGSRLANELISGFEGTVQRGIELVNISPRLELSEKVYRNEALSNRTVQRIVQQGIIRGFSAKEIARDVAHLIKPSTPGGVSYAAMRLGRTELNNAFHARQIAEADRPWVQGVKWNRSKSHPKRDICDTYADHNEGLGRGVWEKGSVPDKPHPHCFCYMTYEVMNEQEALQLILNGGRRASGA
jgi:hypothetical protein